MGIGRAAPRELGILRYYSYLIVVVDMGGRRAYSRLSIGRARPNAG
jgi:hypothetical protein